MISRTYRGLLGLESGVLEGDLEGDLSGLRPTPVFLGLFFGVLSGLLATSDLTFGFKDAELPFFTLKGESSSRSAFSFAVNGVSFGGPLGLPSEANFWSFFNGELVPGT